MPRRKQTRKERSNIGLNYFLSAKFKFSIFKFDEKTQVTCSRYHNINNIPSKFEQIGADAAIARAKNAIQMNLRESRDEFPGP